MDCRSKDPLQALIPYDVESVTVLKDAAAASIYGARASGGVIVVTTKKAKDKGTTIEVSGNLASTNKPDYRLPELHDACTAGGLGK